jgi:tryptophan halogenase
MVDTSELRWLWQQAVGQVEDQTRRHRRIVAHAQPRRVLVVGGGTAGYLTAIAISRHTDAAVTLVESSQIGHIGVGEATVPNIVPFLHDYLGIDVQSFYAEVKPTWKLGIRFQWGRPQPYHFLAPFDWGVDSIGALGSLHECGSLDQMSVLALLMAAKRVPMFRWRNGEIGSLLTRLHVAYHVSVDDLVPFLAREAERQGVARVDAVVRDVVLAPDGRVSAVMTDRGPLSADFFVDCSGFRALLIGQALGSGFVDYGASLFTDCAVAFERDHGGAIAPYTTATTMKSGWTWTIPQRDSDHCGYVFSSRFCTPDSALEEARQRFGPMTRELRLIRFRSGRRDRSWIANVAAVGNASGFVEPLESSGLLMTATSIRLLVDALNTSDRCDASAPLYNEAVATQWDGLRWFLSLHYRFNQAEDSVFWQAARNDTDYSGLEEVVREFNRQAPLRLRDRETVRNLERGTRVLFYGVAGIDSILFGQRVPTNVPRSAEDHAIWKERRDRVAGMIRHALTMSEAIQIPELGLYHSRAVPTDEPRVRDVTLPPFDASGFAGVASPAAVRDGAK